MKTIYFNFPIAMLRHRTTYERENIEQKMMFKHNMDMMLVYTTGERLSKGLTFKDITEELNVRFANTTDGAIKYRIKIFKENSYPMPMTGINSKLYWDFRNNEKTDFEFYCLWAFLAIKSILGNKPYQKITNELLIARIAGHSTFKEYQNYLTGFQPPEHIQKISTRWKLDRIKKELTRHYNIKFYGHQTRGFYVSTKLTLESLIMEVEKNRIKHKEVMEKNEIQDTRRKVLEQLEQERELTSTLKQAGIKPTSTQQTDKTETNTKPTPTPAPK